MTLQERTKYLHRVQYYGQKMMLLQGQWGEQNIQVMCRGRGVGPLLVRLTTRSSTSRLTQEATFNTQMNEMMKKWEEKKRISDERWEEERRRANEDRRIVDEDRRRADEERKQTNERIAKQDQMMEKMQKMIDDLARANASLLANSSSASRSS
jgi:membrane-bound lytic murein transglycosylase B